MEGFIMADVKGEKGKFTIAELAGFYAERASEFENWGFALTGYEPKNKSHCSNVLAQAVNKWAETATTAVKTAAKNIGAVSSKGSAGTGSLAAVPAATKEPVLEVFDNISANLASLARLRYNKINALTQAADTQIDAMKNEVSAAETSLETAIGELAKAKTNLATAKSNKGEWGKKTKDEKQKLENAISTAKTGVKNAKATLKERKKVLADAKKEKEYIDILKKESKAFLKKLKVTAKVTLGVASYKTYGNYVNKMYDEIKVVAEAINKCGGAGKWTAEGAKNTAEWKALMKLLKASQMSNYAKVLAADLKPEIKVDADSLDDVNTGIQGYVDATARSMVGSIQARLTKIKDDKSLSNSFLDTLKQSIKGAAQKFADVLKSKKADKGGAPDASKSDASDDKAVMKLSVILATCDSNVATLLKDQGVSSKSLIANVQFAVRVAIYATLLSEEKLLESTTASQIASISNSKELFRMLAAVKFWYKCVYEMFAQLGEVVKGKIPKKLHIS